MAESEEESQYKQEFITRVREARARTGLKQWQIAKGLNIPQDHYKHYEVLTDGKGRLMPHYLVPRFAVLCRVNVEWLMTGEGKKAWQPLEIIEGPKEPHAKPKRGRTKAA